jgi:hypothetical protein
VKEAYREIRRTEQNRCFDELKLDFWKKMAGVMGLEPTAFAVTGRRCNQLNYTPAIEMSLQGIQSRGVCKAPTRSFQGVLCWLWAFTPEEAQGF